MEGDPMETKTTKVAVSKKLFQAIHDALIANKLAPPGQFEELYASGIVFVKKEREIKKHGNDVPPDKELEDYDDDNDDNDDTPESA